MLEWSWVVLVRASQPRPISLEINRLGSAQAQDPGERARSICIAPLTRKPEQDRAVRGLPGARNPPPGLCLVETPPINDLCQIDPLYNFR